MINIEADLSVLDNRNLAAIYQRHYERLGRLFDGQTLDRPFCLSGVSVATSDPGIDPAEWFAASIADLAKQVPEACDDLVFRPMSIGYNPRGVHFIDDLFGADVFLHPFSGQWQVHPLKNSVGELTRPDLESNVAWGKVREIAKLFLMHDPSNVVLELPTLSSALNIAVNLYGEEILVAMLTRPEAARYDLRIINDVIVKLHTWFLQNIPVNRLQPIATSGRFQPFGRGQICGCTTQLVSKELYDSFIMPLDREVLALYSDSGLIHLCGAHAQHIPSWRAMTDVKCIQLNDRAAEDLNLYFRGLRSDQILYVNYCDDMPLERALDITNGTRLVLAGEFTRSGGLNNI